MKKSSYAAISGLAAGALAAGSLTLAGDAAAAPAGKAHTVTIKAHETSGHDNRKTGHFVESDRDTRNGSWWGDDVVQGHIDLAAHAAIGYVTISRLTGTIRLKFRQTDNGALSGKILGGTGKYKTITGTVTGNQVSQKVTKVTLNYTLG